MTNEEKVKKYCYSHFIKEGLIHRDSIMYHMNKILKWKDECFKSFLKDKYKLWTEHLISGNNSMKIKISGLEEIYEDYFGESIDEPNR